MSAIVTFIVDSFRMTYVARGRQVIGSFGSVVHTARSRAEAQAIVQRMNAPIGSE